MIVRNSELSQNQIINPHHCRIITSVLRMVEVAVEVPVLVLVFILYPSFEGNPRVGSPW
jgi:hypothetical protein